MRAHRPTRAAEHDTLPPHSRRVHSLLSARIVRVALLLMLAAVSTVAARISAWAATPGAVVVMSVDGAIGPASADFIVRTLNRAAQQHAALAILQLDTPGGLDTAMREIIKTILASPVPVAAFVAPGGARAASAGTYIVYASHIAAMAPGTNLGAASPVQLGMGTPAQPTPATPATAPATPGIPSGPPAASPGSGASAPLPSDTASTETRKMTHDAAAYIRGLAQLRGRNAVWAERAVREAVSLSANEALDQHVIDLIAADPVDLAHKVDGRVIATAAGSVRLATAHAPLVYVAPDWRSRFLAIIADPNVALILLTIGVYGLFFEFANPGFVLPGVAGGICLLVGLFALQLLPVNYAGLGLVLMGLGCLVAEAFLPTFGVLGFGGIIAFAVGALMLMDTDVPGYGIPLPLIAGLTLGGAVFVACVSAIALRARRRPVVTGAEAMVGSIGEVIDEGLQIEHVGTQKLSGWAIGWARVRGERWRVACAIALTKGARVRVTARDGLMLTVAPLGDAAAPQERQQQTPRQEAPR
ncbi:NfeD family protein [Paraburkholderia bannensis]|uniref:NfeD family protein n=1 Tax=Paraburkholderia bannensis TaxID=765414 RepID=UPI002AC3590E|nr:nodulation protein NfeD [Paraburkholderia bannensis]